MIEYKAGSLLAEDDEAPAMTTGRAVLVVLMHRYLAGLLDPFVTLLEVHKLMYFMQVAGEPLRLRFKKAPYGPYAQNLRHVLNALEGHLISGYDGEDAPDKPLELVPGALEDAQACLREHGATQQRLSKVGRLVEGFESSFGLELLASVHWVMQQDKASAKDEVVESLYGWNERKRQFTPRQIGLAMDVLSESGWPARG